MEIEEYIDEQLAGLDESLQKLEEEFDEQEETRQQEINDNAYDEFLDRQLENFDEALQKLEQDFTSGSSLWTNNKAKFWKHVASYAESRMHEYGENLL